MGIKSRDGALFMATGIDNSGLYEGKREAMGIIKTLASEVTSFDIFSGIGISAATAFAQAAKSSYDFEKEFRKNMLEVATISTQVTDDMTGFMNQVKRYRLRLRRPPKHSIVLFLPVMMGQMV